MGIGDHGLAKQIKYVEDNIAIKKQMGKDASFEEGLVKEWRKYLPGGSKHHMWVQHAFSGRRPTKAGEATESQI